jgi:hypothetical protein
MFAAGIFRLDPCDFGRSGQAYVETDPTQADASTIVRNFLDGQYNRPVRVLALNVEEGWVRDVSQVIAAKVRHVARRDGQGLTLRLALLLSLRGLLGLTLLRRRLGLLALGGTASLLASALHALG